MKLQLTKWVKKKNNAPRECRTYLLFCRHGRDVFDIHLKVTFEPDGQMTDDGRQLDASRWYLDATIDDIAMTALMDDSGFRECLFDPIEGYDGITDFEQWLTDEVNSADSTDQRGNYRAQVALRGL